MMKSMIRSIPLLLALIFILMHVVSSARDIVPSERKITFDERAIKVNGRRVLLQVGAIHYPRSTVDMWADQFKKMREAGLNTVETYVFWDIHEPERGRYDFTGNRDLLKFIEMAGDAGLYVVLRYGPYVCAEWNYGGFPAWLREIPGMQFRTDNAPFKREMYRFLAHMVDYTRDSFWENGGPVILLQIENEYGNVEREYGEAGHAYIEWAAAVAKGFDTSLPWFMCQQDNVSSLINACNGFYCDEWVGRTRKYMDQPGMFTENWTGWFTAWGEVKPTRPAEDLAFSVARWFARGGTYNAYYMWFGGTNFGRSAGGPGLITSYDYDAPVDEYGMAAEPKFSHLAQLHHILANHAETLLHENASSIALGSSREAHMFGEFASSNRSLLFISNLSHDNDTSVTLGGMVYHVPRWSVTIVQGPAYAPRILYNTAYIDAVIGRSTYRYEVVSEAQLPLVKSRAEPVGISQQGRARFQTTPAEQISFTRDTTDYLWYVLPHLPEEMSRAVKAAQLADIPTVNLTFSEVHDHATVYFNGQRIGDARGGHNVTFPIAVTLFVYPWEDNSIAVLTQTMGLSNYGPHREEWSRGITGTVVFAGVDLTEGGWLHQAGLLGEQQKVFEGVNDDAFKDVAVTTTVDPLTWLRIDLPEVYISTDYDDAAYVVDMVSMVKGVAWMNGHPLGRYWSLTAKLPTSPINSTDPYPFPGDGVTGGVSTLESEAPTQPFLCNYAGPFSQDKCRDPKSVGQPTQRYYHIPRAWIHGKGEGNNTLVLFEEQGGDLKCVRLLKVVREVVSRVESMPALKMQV